MLPVRVPVLTFGFYSSIEGITIIIASCIPLMMPLLRLVTGRPAITDYGVRYTERISDNARSPGIPLASNISKSRTRTRVNESEESVLRSQ